MSPIIDVQWEPLNCTQIINKTSPEDYDRRSRHIPDGWDIANVKDAQDGGYFLFGINMLQPAPGHWNTKLLLTYFATHSPNILDHFLVHKQN